MPIGLKVQIDGLEQLQARLGKAIAQETLQAPLERALERIKARLQTYPPERPGQAYQRTGNLGRGWHLSIGPSGGSLTNRVAYGPFVQGDKTQSWMHKGRWTTDQQAADHETPAIERDFEQAVEDALSR